MTTETVFMWVALASYAIATALFGIGVTFFKERLMRPSLIVSTVGLAAQAVSLGVRWIRVGHGPYLGFYEVASLLVLFAVAFFVAAAWRNARLSPVGIGIMPVALLLLGGSMLASQDVVAVTAKLDSYWLFIHVAFANLAFGALAVSFGGAIIYVMRQRSVGGKWAKRLEKLPPQGALENLTVRFVLVGFFLWGMMIATGAIWANEAWGRYWGWDPIETWSLVVWIIYAVYLHLRFTLKWHGEKLAWYAIVAMPLALFALIGIPFAFGAPHAGIGGYGKDI